MKTSLLIEWWNKRLIVKLLAIHGTVIFLLMAIVWWSVDYLAADYFSELMEKYHISPESSHDMFVDAVHHYLIGATAAGVVLAVLLSFLMMNRTLRPLNVIIDVIRRISSGDYSIKVPVRSSDEVGQLSEAFNTMARDLARMENMRKQLMIDVAHELRTPLTNMKGYLEALKDDVIAPTKQTISLLQEETFRLVHLTEDILRLTRADAAVKTLSLKSTNPVTQLKNELRAMEKSFRDKNISVMTDFPKYPVNITADPRMLGQVLRNLLENASRYTPENENVQITVTATDNSVKTNFVNTVEDFNKDSLPLLFERFYRGEKSRSRDLGGAGIGLAIVKELIEAHGGRVYARYQENKLTVGFSLPLKQ